MSIILNDPQIWLVALGIFTLRVVNLALSTVRILTVVRGMKFISFMLGVMESSLFLVALGSVINNLNNILYIVAYAGGYATGGLVGMFLEERLAFGYIQVTVISSKRGKQIASQLRKNGHAVTEVDARGKDGVVTLLECNVQRRHLQDVRTIICKSDDSAFITTRDIQPLHRGYWRTN
jgi:uncharacterized protein YebE (UPF0316 family)